MSDEQLSALLDGELVGAQREQAMSELLGDCAAQKQWHIYHLAGDVLRSADLSPVPEGIDFLQRLEARLACEPVPRRLGSQDLQAASVAGAFVIAEDPATGQGTRSANRTAFHWRATYKWAVLASCAAVALLIWRGMSVAEPMMAQGKSGVQAPLAMAESLADQDVIRDPDLDALLSAHRAMGGNSALQLPSGFLRNATFERPAR